MEALLEKGCIIVCTSNRAPWELNRHGLHEDLFGHFIQNLLQACEPFQLSAEKDYRRLLVMLLKMSSLTVASHHCVIISPCKRSLQVFLNAS